MSENYTAPIVIESAMDIDDLLVKIAALDKQISDYKDLKKHRTKSIDEATAQLEAKKEQIRGAIQSFMKDNSERTLRFPGVGTVQRKSMADAWDIQDEKKVIEQLSAHFSTEAIKDVIVEVPKLDKKAFSILMGNTPEDKRKEAFGDLVSKLTGRESIAISFAKDGDQERIRDLKDIAINEAEGRPAIEKSGFDGLEI